MYLKVDVSSILANINALPRRLYTTMIFKKTGSTALQQNSNQISRQKHESPQSAAGASSMFAPHSPEGPPPGAGMSSMFAPHSPEGPQPGAGAPSMFAPHSPEGPPPGAGASSMFAPHSPEGPPPGAGDADTFDEAEDEGDPYLERILKIREVAIRLAGGDDIWDALEEDDVDVFMELAEKEVDLDR